MRLQRTYSKVSIIIVNFNGGQEPIDCLQSVHRLFYPKNKLEIIVVDNGSIDGSVQEIAKKFPEVRLIRLEKDIGYPASLNLGILNSKSNYIFLGNDDVTLEKNSISQMVDYLKSNKTTAVVGGKVFIKDSHKQSTDSANDYNFYTGAFKTPKNNSSILWLQSCAIMTTRHVVEKIGLFDRDYYPLYFDDFDFCLRAKRAGFDLAYLPQAIFWHGGGKTTAKYPSLKVYYWWYKNKIRFTIKNSSLLQILCTTAVLFVSVTIKSLGEKQPVFYPFAKALLFNLYYLSKTLKSKKITIVGEKY